MMSRSGGGSEASSTSKSLVESVIVKDIVVFYVRMNSTTVRMGNVADGAGMYDSEGMQCLWIMPVMPLL